MTPPAPAAPRGPTHVYAALEPATAEWLRGVAASIREFCRDSAAGMVRCGQQLAEVRARVKRYTFRAWIAAELPWSRTHVYRLIAAAETFGALIEPAGDARIEPTALYLLSSPRVPNQSRALAVEIAQSRRVTVADARQILSATCPRPAEPNPKEVRAYEESVRGLRPTEAQLARESAACVAGQAGADATGRAWAALESLYRGAEIIHIARIEEDGDEEDAGHPLASVTVYSEDGRPRNVVRRRLDDAIAAAAGLEPEKACAACEESRPVSMFGDNEQEADGRNRYCRSCERARLAGVKRRQREKGKKG